MRIPTKRFAGTVTFKAFQLDPTTRTLDARVVENPGLRLRPGMFGRYHSATLPVVAAVPTTAPATGDGLTPADLAAMLCRRVRATP